MKLYTEEQVIKMIEKSRQTGLTAEFLVLTNEGIELPSVDEINDEWEVGHSDYQNGCNYGAKWMLHLIKGDKTNEQQ